MMAPPFILPTELYQLIFSFVTHKPTLLSLINTCRSVRALVLPQFFHYLYLPETRPTSWFRCWIKGDVHASALARHVRTSTLHMDDRSMPNQDKAVLEQIELYLSRLAMLPNLEELVLTGSLEFVLFQNILENAKRIRRLTLLDVEGYSRSGLTPPVPDSREDLDRLVDIVSTFAPQIHFFSLTGVDLVKAVLGLSTPSFHLVELRMGLVLSPDLSLFSRFISSMPSLQVLDFGINHDGASSPHAQLDVRPGDLPNLKVLSCPLPLMHAIVTSARPPKVQRLVIDEYSLADSTTTSNLQLRTLLASCAGSLTSLDIPIELAAECCTARLPFIEELQISYNRKGIDSTLGPNMRLTEAVQTVAGWLGQGTSSDTSSPSTAPSWPRFDQLTFRWMSIRFWMIRFFGQSTGLDTFTLDLASQHKLITETLERRLPNMTKAQLEPWVIWVRESAEHGWTPRLSDRYISLVDEALCHLEMGFEGQLTKEGEEHGDKSWRHLDYAQCLAKVVRRHVLKPV